MEKFIKTLFMAFCEEETVFTDIEAEKKEFELISELEKTLSQEQKEIFDKYLELSIDNGFNESLASFYKGLKVGLKLLKME